MVAPFIKRRRAAEAKAKAAEVEKPQAKKHEPKKASGAKEPKKASSTKKKFFGKI